MKAEIRVDMSSLLRFTNGIAKQVPFATSVAINRSLSDSQKAIRRVMPQVFDSPTRWAISGVKVENSTKRDLRGRVYLDEMAGKGIAAERFLLAQVLGGERRYKRFEKALQLRGLLPTDEYAVPTKHVPKDPNGNVPNGLMVQILSYLQAFGEQGYRANMTSKSRGRRKLDKAGTAYFIARLGNGKPIGIYERRSTGWGDAVRPLFIFVKAARYKSRLDFFGIARATYDAKFSGHFQDALAEAVRTAR